MWATRAAAAALLLLGCLLGLWLFRPSPAPVIETPAPAIAQADGSQVLARAPTTPRAKPTHQLPAGAQLERVMQVTAQAHAEPTATTDGKLESAPVTVDLSLVRMPDQTRRVVASSPDGEIVGGLDIPVDTHTTEAPKWAVGIYANPVDRQQVGVFIDRDVGRLRVGLELGKNKQRNIEARLKVGITF